MDIKELREKTDVELNKALADARNRLRELRFKEAAKQLSDVREIRETRKAIAQMLTLLAERQQKKELDQAPAKSAAQPVQAEEKPKAKQDKADDKPAESAGQPK